MLTVCLQYFVVVTRVAPNNSMAVLVEVAIHHFSINILCSAPLRSPSPSTALPVSYFVHYFIFPANFYCYIFICFNCFLILYIHHLHPEGRLPPHSHLTSLPRTCKYLPTFFFFLLFQFVLFPPSHHHRFLLFLTDCLYIESRLKASES